MLNRTRADADATMLPDDGLGRVLGARGLAGDEFGQRTATTWCVSVGVDVFSTHTRYVDAPTRPSRGLTKEEYPSRGAPSQPSNRWTPGSARLDAGNPDFAGEGVVKTELIPGRGPMTPCAPAARSAPAAAGTRRRRSSSG